MLMTQTCYSFVCDDCDDYIGQLAEFFSEEELRECAEDAGWELGYASEDRCPACRAKADELETLA